MPKLLINGQQASIDVSAFASFHGNSVFTTLRSKDKEPLYWQHHWQRLSAHAEHFSYKLPNEKHILSLIVEQMSKMIGDQKIRVIISDRNFALSFEDYVVPPAHIYDGVTIRISTQKLHPDFKIYKTGNSLPYMLAHNEAIYHQVFESLLLDQDGFVVDGSRTSIMHFDGKILVSLLGGLDGIMRKQALRFAKEAGIVVKLDYMKVPDLKGQLLLANSLMGVIPVGLPRFAFVKDVVDFFRMS